MEAATVVEEILSELLASICSPSHPQSLRTVLHQPPLDHQPLLIDLSTLSRERCQLLNPHSLRSNAETKLEVCQIKALKQQASGYCGHYALYFSLSLLRLCDSQDKTEAQKALEQLTDRENFWRRYWLSIGELLAQVSPESWWPWTREHVCAGEIERSYLRHLLHTHLASTTKDRVFVIQYAFGLLQDPLDHISTVQDAINLFVNRKRHVLVFVLGVTNHWVSLLAYRHCQDKIGLLYLDSNNEPVLRATETDIDELVKAREEKRIKRTGTGYNAWKRNILRQSLCDQRDVVGVMAECLQGTHTLPREHVSSHWDKMLTNYRKVVTSAVSDIDNYTVQLLHWLESGYSVCALNNGYIQPLLFYGWTSLLPRLQNEVIHWTEECSLIQTLRGFEQIDSFLELVDNLNSFIKSNN